MHLSNILLDLLFFRGNRNPHLVILKLCVRHVDKIFNLRELRLPLFFYFSHVV